VAGRAVPGIASGTMNLLLLSLGLVALVTGASLLDATRHAGLPRFSAVMPSFLLPLALISLLVVMRGQRSRCQR
jgi:hypothetical protein